MTADLAGMLLGALLVVSLSMLVYMALSIILMLLNCALSLVISAIIDLFYVLFHKQKKVGVFAFTSFDMVSPKIYCVHQYILFCWLMRGDLF